jgi:cobalamin synthase
MMKKGGQLILTYAPFWLQVGYLLLKALIRTSVDTIAGDICFAGFSFVVWGLTMNMSAGKKMAGGGRYRNNMESRRSELGWCLLLLLLSLAGMTAGYRKDGLVIIAYVAGSLIAIIGTNMLREPTAKGKAA